MKYGVALNLPERTRYTDSELLFNTISLVAEAVSNGLESVFAYEHHRTGYLVSPAPFSLLSYMAGRFPSLHLGTMVAVVPWYSTTRLAEEIAQLDNLQLGNCTFGLGRGRSVAEHTLMGTSKPDVSRFNESVSGLAELLADSALGERGRLRPSAEHSPHRRFAFPAADINEAMMMARNGKIALLEWTSDLAGEMPDDLHAEVQKLSSRIVLVAPSIVDDDQARLDERRASAIQDDRLRRQTHYGGDPSDLEVLSGSSAQVLEELNLLSERFCHGRIVLEVVFGDLDAEDGRRTLRNLYPAMRPTAVTGRAVPA